MIDLIMKFYANMFAREKLIKLNNLLFNLSIRGLGVYNYQNMEISGEINLFKNHIVKYAKGRDRFIVFDVGSNKGDYVKVISSHIDNADVYVFEPHPKTFQILQENIKNVKNVRCFNLALGDIVTKLNLYDYQNSDGSTHASLIPTIFTTVHKSKTTSHKINITTVDNISKEIGLEYIDFLKIDVEGYELNVLKGARELLKNKKISIIQFEFTQLNTTTRVFFKDFHELLANNYKIFRLLPNSLLEIKSYNPTSNEIFGYQNFVAFLRT